MRAIAIGLLAVNAALAGAGESSEYATAPLSRSAMFSAKSGTVLDAETGAGIAGATVIASWHIHSTGWERDGGGCVVRHIVSTDAAGNFILPDVSASPWFHLPRASVAERIQALAGYTDFAWYLAVYKPGYLRRGDAESLARNTEQNPAFLDWEWKPPRVHATRDGYRVVSIALAKDRLPPAQEMLYLAKIQRFADCHPNPPVPPSPHHDALLEQIRQVVRPIPCSLPETTPIPAWAAAAFYQLDGGGDPDHEPHFRSGQGTADTFYSRMGIAAAGGPMSLNWHDTTAGVLCWAQGQRETKP
jgi:hypothetical protein